MMCGPSGGIGVNILKNNHDEDLILRESFPPKINLF